MANKFLLLDFYVVALCNLGFTICGSYISRFVRPAINPSGTGLFLSTQGLQCSQAFWWLELHSEWKRRLSLLVYLTPFQFAKTAAQAQCCSVQWWVKSSCYAMRLAYNCITSKHCWGWKNFLALE